MKKQLLATALLAGSLLPALAQSPVITSWKINDPPIIIKNGSVSIIADVEAVYYDSSTVYVKTSGVPSYYNFNTNTNVNAASDLKDIFKITRTPKQNMGTPFSTLGGGQYGVAKDGTLIFNGEDARSYNNQNVWHSLAYYFENKDFDNTWGHSTPTNEYHHHVLDLALQDTTKDMVHSPILGYAFDGYPIYGPFAYKDANDTKSKVIRMTSSYQKRNITDRTTLSDGTQLTGAQIGPSIGGQYPLGCYREDYVLVANSGTLDEHNGRFCKTPEYPNGTYAYFAILDSTMKPAYPYTFGWTLYGAADASQLGPNGGKNVTIPSNAVKYDAKTGIENTSMLAAASLYPNPAQNELHVTLPEQSGSWNIAVKDIAGKTLITENYNGMSAAIQLSGLGAGVYIINITSQTSCKTFTGRFIKTSF